MAHRLPLTATLTCLTAFAIQATAADALVRPGVGLAVIDTPHLHALVPAAVAEQLRPVIARAEVVYAALAKDAGYTITQPLTLLVTDDSDTHNGFSTVTPTPIINVQLAPALQSSFIFTGHDEFERTLVHELTHHMSNDRDPNGFRRTMSNIFGRILPNDLLSLAVAYLSTPAHQTMPSFWHEGCAQWAETEYARPGSPWGGRGRDSLTHMVWRLDAAGDGIPQPGDWRLSQHRWPFGTSAYLYGIAYTRWLAAAVKDRASIWQLIERQEHRWAFAFNGGPQQLLGKDHLTLIGEARTALLAEQRRALATLRTQPLTVAKRLTPEDGIVGAPAWLPDGRLFAAYNGPYDDPGYVRVDREGRVTSAGYRSWAMGQARSLPDGTLVFSESAVATNPWSTNRVSIVTTNGHRVRLDHRRLLQPDLRPLTGVVADGTRHYHVAAIHLTGDGNQALTLCETTVDDGFLFADAETGPLDRLPTQGRPWSPAFRPGHDDVTWVETDATGSRLVSAPVIIAHPEPGANGQPVRRPATLGARTVLAEIPGRIMQPVWTADGSQLFFCADHSGVANAYRLDPAKPGVLVPVTNTIGGVLACVPSPDGRELALIDHDRRGPFLARIANDPATWPKEAPHIARAWPAPLAGAADAADPKPRFSLPEGVGEIREATLTSYHGLIELRPLFWTPTTLAVPEGGYGIIGVAADPIYSHEFVGSVGAGPAAGSPVGLASYLYSGGLIDFGVVGWQAERSFDEQIVDSFGRRYDYTENRRSAEVLLGTGLTGFRRRFQLFGAAGIAEYRPVHSHAKKYAGQNLINLAPFTGVEQYTEAVLAYDDGTLFPTGYSREDGLAFAVTYRHSGYGGDLDGDRVLGLGSYVFSVLPSWGQQLVVGGAVGWSEGDRFLQGQFSVGGTFNLNQLPRGYTETTAIGSYLVGGTVAWRTPVWRPFWGHSTTPFVTRQAVLEVFFDGAKASSDRLDGDGEWFRSVGANLHMNMMVWELMVNPGIGVAKQLDGDEDATVLFGLDFLW